MYSAQQTPAVNAKKTPIGSSAVAASPPGSGSNKARPTTASVTHSQSLAFLEVQTATASGPVNSMAMATPKGMVLMAL